MFAVAAAALAQVGLGDTYAWINKAGDIATDGQVDPSKNQYFLSQGGETVFTLSQDLTLTHGQFYAQSVLQGNAYWYARCVYDFRKDGNHVLTVNPGFFLKGICAKGTTDEDHLDDLHAEHVFLGGTWDFNGKSFQCGYGGSTWGDQCDHMEVTVDGSTFRNIGTVYMLQKSRDSKVTFKNGAKLDASVDGSTKTLYGFYPCLATDINNEIRYESGTKVTCYQYQDSLNWAFGGGDPALPQDWNCKTVITGEGTEINASGTAYFSMYLGGVTTIIDDKAVFTSNSGTMKFGADLAAHNGTLIIDNDAKLNGASLQMGQVANDASSSLMMENMTLKVGDGAELHLTGQFMSAGKGNTLILSNGTFKADGQYAFYFGHMGTSSDKTVKIESSDYSLVFQGENPRIITGGDTQIRQTHAIFELVPGHTYTEPFITGKKQAFISDGSTIEFKYAKEYCQQLEVPVEIALIYDADPDGKDDGKGGRYWNASFNAPVSGLPDGCKVYRSDDGKCVYLNLIPLGPDFLQVGENTYASFGEAAAAAQDGDTIKMLSDATIEEAGVFGAKDNLTLDLAGFTLTSLSPHFQFNKGAATTLTLADSSGAGATFKFEGGNWMTGWQNGTEGSTLIIEEGVTIDLGSNSIFEGHVYDNQLVHVKKGAAITSTGGACFYVGYNGNYNTLLIEGAVDFNRLLLGHPNENTKEPTYGAKIIIRGQDAVVNERAAQIYPMTGSFGGVDGEIVYDDCTIDSDKDFYWHSTNPLFTGNQLTLINGAHVKYADIWMGREGSAQEPCVPALGQRIFIGEDCTLEVGTQFMMTGSGNTLTVSNGTFLAGSKYAFYWGHGNEYTDCDIANNAINIVGPYAKLRSLDPDNAQFVIHGSTVTFDLSEGVYEEAPFMGNSLELHDDNDLVFKGLNDVISKLESGDYGEVDFIDIPLMQSASSPMCFCFSKEKRAQFNRTLPENCELLVNEDATLAYLHVEIYQSPVAQIGDRGYGTLQKAFNAAQPGDVIELVDDIELNSTAVLNGKSEITLDFMARMFYPGEEFEEGAPYLMVTNGDLTLTDSSGESWMEEGTLMFVAGEGGLIKIVSGSYMGDMAAENGGEILIPGDSVALFGQDWSKFCEAGFETAWDDDVGYYVVRPKEGGLVPGEPVVVEAEDEDEALEKAPLTVPDELAELGDEELIAQYHDLFNRSASDNGDGTWTVTAELKEEVEAEIQEELTEGSEEILSMLGEEGEVTIMTKPGLYYSVAAGGELGEGMTEGDRVMGDGGELALDVPAAEGETFFYQLKVNATPSEY